MGRQNGLLEFTGTIGNLSFYKTPDGYFVRRKNSITRDQVLNDPSFVRTLENASEFAQAAFAGRLLRTAFRQQSYNKTDHKVHSRLAGRVVKVIQSDPTHARGKRELIHGDAKLLEGFEFNDAAKLQEVLKLPYRVEVNRATASAAVVIPAFIPGNGIMAPKGTTHFRFNAGAASINFGLQAQSVDIRDTDSHALSEMEVAEVRIDLKIPGDPAGPLFITLGIDFLQEVNGVMNRLQDMKFGALSLVRAEW
jgi:transcriptional regulator of heat shock response